MMSISSFLILMLNLYSSLSIEEFINNPVRSNKPSNVVEYTYIFDLEKNSNIIMTYDSNKTSVILNFENAYYHSYIYSHDFFMFNNETNKNFLLVNKQSYFITKKNEKYIFTYEKDAQSNYKYIGYIQRKNSKETKIILYGEKNNKIYFKLLPSGKSLDISIGTNDGYFSCKFLTKRVYFCAYSKNNILYLKYFTLFFGGNEKTEMNTKSFSDFIVHDNIILYDTSKNKIKILCTKSIDNSEIECTMLEISYDINDEDEITSVETKFIDIKKEEYKMKPSYEVDNCNYTMFNSEYLICCGKEDIIICERRDMNLKLIDLFNITLSGKIRNLTIENTDNEYVTLYYNNITHTGDENIYEYYIYPPKCENNAHLELSQFQSKSLNTDNLFKRNTNTNYYIILNNYPVEYGKIYINDELCEKDKKFLITDGNILTFISDNNKTVENLEIEYNISIHETYSTKCSLFLTIKSCYKSCKTCTDQTPDNNHHFCLSCKIEDEYYPYSSIESLNNCYNKKEMDSKQISYYFDEDKKSFVNCAPECQTCNGARDYNCLSCKNDNNYLHQGKCYSQCPNKTFPFIDSAGNKICKDCHQNCETCQSLGDDDYMDCLTCPKNYIFFKYYNEQNFRNCYYVISYKSKIFYSPNNQLISCKIFSKYIIENTNECIDELKEGHYVSNNETNILSLCHSSCKTCNNKYTDNDTNCLICSSGYFKTEESNTNCILESQIKPNYYKNEYNYIYYKCHENCFNCTSGFNILNGNMNCIMCQEGFYKLNGTDNCYNMTFLNKSYYFKDNMFFNCDENCLTCSEGKNETSNNCLSCDANKGLYLVDKLNNCKFRNYSGYYLDTNNVPQILKKCYYTCKSCLGPFIFDNISKIENHNCQECEDN